MKRVYVFLTFVFSLLLEAAAIEPVMVTENTFKLNGEETLYYGFASGDQIIFDFSETSGKEVKEVEIVEMPSNTKFQDFKTSGVSNKTIKVAKKGLYAFRFKNPAIAKRICKVKIQRIPADESKISFDTGWRYEEVKDTTVIPYTEDSIVGYDEQQYTEVVRELVKTEYEEFELFDNSAIEVRSKGIVIKDNPRETVMFQIPSFKNDDPMVEKRVSSWALWLATGEDAETFWTRNKQQLKEIASSSAGMYFANPLAAYAAGIMVDLVIPEPGTDNTIKYSITDSFNANLFMQGQQYVKLNKGSGAGAKLRFTSRDMLARGNYVLCLENPNQSKRIKVSAKAVAVVEVNYYKNVEYQRVRSIPKTVTLNKTRLDIKTRQVMMMNGEE